jgi:hypothetical protein
LYLLATPATIESCALVPRLFSRASCWRPVGAAAAAVMQIADINEGKFSRDNQSAISFLMIDFTFLEGRDGELLAKE